MRFYMERVEATANFANKIWNASKFVIMNLGDFDETFVPEDKDLTLADRWILTSFNETVAKVTEDLDKFELGDAADAVYNFIWNSYCDWYIELAKKRLYQAESERDKHTVQYVLVYVLTHTLEMLHPFMPFVTEHLWQHLPHEGESIIVAPWPKTQDKWNFPADAATMNTMMEAIKGIRNLRAESNVPMGKKAPVILAPATEDMAQTLKTYEDYFHTLAFADKVTLLLPAMLNRKMPSSPSFRALKSTYSSKTSSTSKRKQPASRRNRKNSRRKSPASTRSCPTKASFRKPQQRSSKKKRASSPITRKRWLL